jgi:hypothetical protein
MVEGVGQTAIVDLGTRSGRCASVSSDSGHDDADTYVDREDEGVGRRSTNRALRRRSILDLDLDQTDKN